MNHRPLGMTGLSVSEIGFGTGDNAGLMMKGTRQQRNEAVSRALDVGVNYFDTSPDYGKGVAEENLGQILKDLGPADVIVATKVEILEHDLDDVEAAIERSVDASLRRLQRDDVEIVMIHNPPRNDRDASAAHWYPLTPEVMLGSALAGLERLREKGKVRHFGFTCENAEGAAVRAVLDSGKYGVINAWYNLVNPTAGMVLPEGVRYGVDYENYGDIISYAAQAGVGVAAIRPLAGGALAPAVVEMGARARHPLAGGLYSRKPEAFEREARRGRAFAFLQSPERSLSRAAFRFVLMNRSIATVVGGFSDLAQFQELVDAADDRALDDAEMAQIRDVYSHDFYLGDG